MSIREPVWYDPPAIALDAICKQGTPIVGLLGHRSQASVDDDSLSSDAITLNHHQEGTCTVLQFSIDALAWSSILDGTVNKGTGTYI